MRHCARRLSCRMQTGVSLGVLAVSVSLFVLVFAQTGHAFATRAGSPAQQSDRVADFSAQECPAMFGSLERHGINATFRKRHLSHVMGASGKYTVIHHNPRWDKPSRLRIQGLHFAESGLDAENRRFVRVILDTPTASRLSCEPGVYRLTRDDNIAPGASILAVLDRTVLVSRHGRLTYLANTPDFSANFRMVWQSRWTIEVQPESSSPAAAPQRQRQQQRRPARRKPRPARRR